MRENSHLTIVSNRKKVVLEVDTILYIMVTGKSVQIHTSNGKKYETRMSLSEIESSLDDEFIKVHRGCIVSAMAIHDITDTINLSNGEKLEYPLRNKKNIVEQLYLKRKKIFENFKEKDTPSTEEEYRIYYSSFENLPIAFTDIEMIFDEQRHAVDWIFRYGNQALAKIERMPLEKMIGNTFGSLFSNMDSKWLRSYERATLFGEVLEIMDYSPEVDRYLKVICFPTFEGHCGCILFDISDIKFTKDSNDTRTALIKYFRDILVGED